MNIIEFSQQILDGLLILGAIYGIAYAIALGIRYGLGKKANNTFNIDIDIKEKGKQNANI